MNEVYEFLNEAKTYFLATNDHGQVRNRPFGTIDIYNNHLYIQTGLSKDCAKQMIEEPRIEICAFHQGRWIRVEAKAYLDEDINAQRHMLDRYPSLQDRYKAGDGNTAVFMLKDVKATIYSFIEEPITYTFS